MRWDKRLSRGSQVQYLGSQATSSVAAGQSAQPGPDKVHQAHTRSHKGWPGLPAWKEVPRQLAYCHH